MVTRRRRSPLSLVLIVMVSAIAVACGSSDGEADTASSTTGQEGTVASSVVVGELAESAVLVGDELPEGWTTTDGDGVVSGTEECAPFDELRRRSEFRTEKELRPPAESGESILLGITILSFPSDEAEAAAVDFSADRTACLEALFGDPDGVASVEVVATEGEAPEPQDGGHSAAGSYDVTINWEGVDESRSITYDWHVARVGDHVLYTRLGHDNAVSDEVTGLAQLQFEKAQSVLG